MNWLIRQLGVEVAAYLDNFLAGFGYAQPAEEFFGPTAERSRSPRVAFPAHPTSPLLLTELSFPAH